MEPLLPRVPRGCNGPTAVARGICQSFRLFQAHPWETLSRHQYYVLCQMRKQRSTVAQSHTGGQWLHEESPQA